MSLMISTVIFTRVDDGYIGTVRELKGLELNKELTKKILKMTTRVKAITWT